MAPTTRRKFPLVFRIEATHRVIDSGSNVVDVAKEIALPDNSQFRWVRDERLGIEMLEGTSNQPLNPSAPSSAQNDCTCVARLPSEGWTMSS
jgi:transposase-like protein